MAVIVYQMMPFLTEPTTVNVQFTRMYTSTLAMYCASIPGTKKVNFCFSSLKTFKEQKTKPFIDFLAIRGHGIFTFYRVLRLSDYELD